jgi:hypothetical protein
LEIKVKQITLIIIILTLVLSAIFIPAYVDASEGLPGSAKFGYGARVDINGGYLEKAIETASYMGLDWVAVDFDWEEMWPDPSSPPKINSLTEVIHKANQYGISVLLTISNPAQWAMTDAGPDPQTTANLTLSLVNFYSGKVLAVELFPGVNTKEVWKADPNATSYLEILKRTYEALSGANQQIALVTTITSEAFNPTSNDINDLKFLSDLYAAGGKPYLTIIGVKYNKLMGDPLTNPGAYVLRHYEEIRSVMLGNGHNYGMIWVTGFSTPTNHNFNSAHSYETPSSAEEVSNWIEEAYKLMRAQLYIGVSFFDQINPSSNPTDLSKVTIISGDSNLHPIADRIMKLVRGLLTDDSKAGSDIETNTYLSILLKKFVRQIDFKHR